MIGYVKGMGMECPKCGEEKSKVEDTFFSMVLNARARRRKCQNCEHVFYTSETVVPKDYRPERRRR